ncbi:hypothetical protein [Sphingomonas sp. G-3-2-10]|uniref:hypothetical protein n=1 Tax=Sphingomonas sp. G-3-2-10 TaxID=2728838 RepID=UPI00146BA2B3|nr:hypothetical protein [Sphingomonas sp. G-3-2-10]NML04290.1 hypothetical protein [Sphingomonas sp. G-3-2-10]
MAFDPKNLIPASQVAAFDKSGGQRTTKQVALDNIKKQIALFKDPKAEGKRNFKTEGDRTAFSIRINNTAMVLETADVKGTKVEVKEMTAPNADFEAALNYYAGRIEKGDFDAQLKLLGDKREARSAKMKETRAAKPKGDAKK